MENIENDVKEGHKCLVIFSIQKNAENFKDFLEYHSKIIRPICLVSLKKVATLEELKSQVKDNIINVIVAVKMFDEGVDIPELSSIHLCGHINNFERLRQLVGRIRRVTTAPKLEPRVRDYFDDVLCYKKAQKDRIKWYQLLDIERE
jgi:superfamily II DNA or RNA helicase